MFRRYFLAPLAALLLLAAAPRLAYAQTGGVGIGTTAPDASALLDLTSTSKGLLPPRLSQARRDAIASPATGLTIYNTTTNKLNTWNGTSWDASLSATEQPFVSGSKATFSYTGGTQTYTVPVGVTSLLVDLAGAQGGRNNGASAGGAGARVQATLAVTPGEVLTICVGGSGSTAPSAPGGAGYNGGGNGGYNSGNRGGGGGGASDVRRSATAPSTALADRLLVAAGGGGGGGSPGGAGGALNGSAGGASAGITAGTGATQSAGGNANGALGQGGDTPAKNLGGGGNSGGGGGGGYYGGGGALSNGGGGGGSSYVQASGSSAVTMTGGYQAGNGYVTLTLPPAYAAPVLSGTNFINVPGTWSVNGTSYYYNNGNVGIGTSTPSQKLDVSGNANVSGNTTLAGSVGIGTSTPSQKLDVSGNANVSGSTSIGGDANVGGNLGVGTSTPSQKLDVAGNANVSGTTSVGGDASVGGNGFIAGQAGIGSSSADASAQLQVTSTTRGFLPPRLSQTQRDAIASPATGLTVYNTTINKLDVWNGTAWTEALTTTEQPITYPVQSFAFTGTTQPYVVPPGVTRLQVDAAGGKGGYNNSVGGLGGRVQTILTVVPGETLYVTVGGQGTVTYSSTPGTGGYNGGGTPGSGGGGGGATDIRRGGTALSNRILVASGGGGGGGGSTGFANGGNGGYPSGTPSPTSSTSGQGGTQTAGGAAGSGDNTASAGSLGQGGNGTGGGGGGYYGGGGGGGAGGGSSYVTVAGSSGTTYSSGTYSSTANYNGSLTLTPRPAYAAPALDATNFVNVPGDNLGNHTATQNLNLSTYLLVGNGGTQGLAISSSGNVSIGTATATQALDVNGGILARASGAISNQGSYLQWNRSGGDGETWLLNQQGGGGGGICFGSATTANATTEWARFDGSGNVGIGTPTPSQKLDVAGNANVSGNSTVGGQLTAASATLGSTTVSGTTTLTGATAINTTGTASTSIGNGTGAVILPGLSTSGFVTNSASGQLGTTTAASLGSSFVLNQSTQQTGATFNVSGAGTVGGALTAGSASITGSATVGGSLGVGISSPAGQLANTASNVIATDGNGISTQGLGWVNTTAVGYAGVFYNARSAANGDGLAVKVASASAVALDVSQGSSATTAGAPLLRVQGSGQVGIGTSAPAGGLHIATGNSGPGTGTATAGAVLSGSPGQPPYLELRGSGTGTSTTTPYIDFAEASDQDYTTRLISQGGTLNVSGSNALLLKVNGSIQATNVVYTSDARFKQHVRPLSSALSSVLALRGVRYEWNALGVAHGGMAGAPQVGLLAQEVEKVYPELVSTDKEGYKAVNYAQLTPVLLEALKELAAQNEALKAELQTVEAQATAHAATATATLEAFEARLRRLEAGSGGQAQR